MGVVLYVGIVCVLCGRPGFFPCGDSFVGGICVFDTDFLFGVVKWCVA